MIRVAGAVIVAVLYLLAPTTAGAQQWRRLDTPNFVFVSDIPARDLREVAAKFEGFREAMGSYIGPEATASIVPTIVVVFSSDAAFGPFRPRHEGRRVDAAGVFLQGRQVNYIGFAVAKDDERGRVLMHELAHLVVSNSGQEVPVWLHEGLAEYYSTLAISIAGEHALVGRLIQGHLNRLKNTKLLTLDELLAITPQSPLYNEGSRQSVFYAQAWALAHMLHNGQPKRVAELNAYLERLSAGLPARQAWDEAFRGADIMADLERYVRRLQFTAFAFPLSRKVEDISSAPVEISRADADAYLGQLLVRKGEYADAGARLAAAEKREPESMVARIGRILLEQERGGMDATARLLAGMTPPGDWLLAYLAGMAKAELVFQGKLPPGAATNAEIRAMFAPAISTGRFFPSMAATLGQVELSGLGQPSTETRAALERARGEAPGYVDVQFAYAQLLMRGGDFEGARAVLTPLDAARHAPQVRELARKLLTQIEARAARAAGRTVTSRVASPDERRTEGTLHHIECAGGKGVTFEVTRAAADASTPAAFVAATLGDIQFVSHRDDFKATVGCGRLPAPMPVRIHWVQAPGGAGRVVAIEFLPPR